MGWGVGANGITGYGCQQSNGSRGSAAPTPPIRNGPRPSEASAAVRGSRGDLVHKFFDVSARDIGHLAVAKQGLDMSFDATAIGCESAFFLAPPPAGKQPSLLGRQQVNIT